MLRLVKPHVQYQHQYLEMLQAWDAIGEKPRTWALLEDPADFEGMVTRFDQFSRGINVPEGFVPSSTFWAYEEELTKMIGAVNIRHSLNEKLLVAWGNIGYEVRPDERQKGYATRILQLTLLECKKLHLNKVLLGCYKENIGSAKTILNNGGSLENEILEEGTGKIIQRYWISIPYDR